MLEKHWFTICDLGTKHFRIWSYKFDMMPQKVTKKKLFSILYPDLCMNSVLFKLQITSLAKYRVCYDLVIIFMNSMLWALKLSMTVSESLVRNHLLNLTVLVVKIHNFLSICGHVPISPANITFQQYKQTSYP